MSVEEKDLGVQLSECLSPLQIEQHIRAQDSRKEKQEQEYSDDQVRQDARQSLQR